MSLPNPLERGPGGGRASRSGLRALFRDPMGNGLITYLLRVTVCLGGEPPRSGEISGDNPDTNTWGSTVTFDGLSQ